MDDFDIAKRLVPFGIISAKAIMSSSRYEVRGVFHLQYNFTILHVLDTLSVISRGLKPINERNIK